MATGNTKEDSGGLWLLAPEIEEVVTSKPDEDYITEEGGVAKQGINHFGETHSGYGTVTPLSI